MDATTVKLSDVKITGKLRDTETVMRSLEGGGQEGKRIGQRRLAVQVLARDATCQICHEQPATEVHHDPPWRELPKHNLKTAQGVCSDCHRQTRQRVVKSEGELR